MQFPQADLRTKEDGEECEEFLAAEAQVVVTNHIDIRGFFSWKKWLTITCHPSGQRSCRTTQGGIDREVTSHRCCCYWVKNLDPVLIQLFQAALILNFDLLFRDVTPCTTLTNEHWVWWNALLPCAAWSRHPPLVITRNELISTGTASKWLQLFRNICADISSKIEGNTSSFLPFVHFR